MPSLILRNAYVTIYPRASNGKGFRLGGDPLNPFKIKFDVEKYAQSGEGSTVKIDLYNLQQSTIATLRSPGTTVQLNAGYGTNTPILSVGNVIYQAPMRLSGSDQVTALEMIESALQMDTVDVNYSLGAGYTNQQELDIVLNQLYAAGVVKGSIAKLSPVISYNRGRSFCGMAKVALRRILHEVNYQFSLSNGLINVSPRLLGTGKVAFLLSPNTGLIDIPTPGSQSDANFTMFEFKSLLNPLLNPSDLIQVQSKYVKNGFYQIFSVKHAGDTLEGKDYTSTITAFFIR